MSTHMYEHSTGGGSPALSAHVLLMREGRVLLGGEGFSQHRTATAYPTGCAPLA